jgi:hypothetical protein
MGMISVCVWLVRPLEIPSFDVELPAGALWKRNIEPGAFIPDAGVLTD